MDTDTEELTYSESARGVLITAERVTAELERHGVTDMADVLDCFGEITAYPSSTPGVTLYDAGDVLDWLGY